MAFAFRSQPAKTFYIFYFVLSTIFVRLPFWVVTSALPATRPRRSWSFGRALLVHVLRALVALQYNTGLSPPPDPEKQALASDELGFVWLEPVADRYVAGDVAAAAKANAVRPARISGYWFGKRSETGSHDYAALPGERVLLVFHGGGYVSASAEPKSPATAITTGIMEYSDGSIQRALAVEYRLASAPPFTAANPFPSALLDALAAYHHLVIDLGFDPSNIVVEGDSSGGHLTVNLAMYLIKSRFDDLPPPAGLIILSPTMDWARTHDHDPASSMTRNYHSDYIHYILASGYPSRAIRGSLSEEELASNPYLSPSSLSLKAEPGLFGSFPPTCIIAGEAEVTLDPMRTFRDRLVADNGAEKVTYHEHADAIHDFLFLTKFEPQRSEALKNIQSWMRSLWNNNALSSSPV